MESLFSRHGGVLMEPARAGSLLTYLAKFLITAGVKDCAIP